MIPHTISYHAEECTPLHDKYDKPYTISSNCLLLPHREYDTIMARILCTPLESRCGFPTLYPSLLTFSAMKIASLNSKPVHSLIRERVLIVLAHKFWPRWDTREICEFVKVLQDKDQIRLQVLATPVLRTWREWSAQLFLVRRRHVGWKIKYQSILLSLGTGIRQEIRSQPMRNLPAIIMRASDK